MFDIEEIQRRAQRASQKASDALQESMAKSEELIQKMNQQESKAEDTTAVLSEEEQIAANAQKQVEILGQIFGADGMAQMAANEEFLQNMVNEKVAETSAFHVNAMMEQLFGEEMGVISAAMETLAMEENGESEEEELEITQESEEKMYLLLDETMARIEALPEPQPIPYGKDESQWERFGILLSGIISKLNNHSLDGMDVEEHIPVLEQQIVSLVRRSWGINGRGDLLDMLRYLTQEGYILRYQMYSEADSPEELMDEDTDEEDRESIARAWRFVQRYKSQYASVFLAGWDIGRAAMLTRWGSYLGWITENEAVGILWDLSQRVVEEIHSWREFAQSYLFGGLMWKLLCGDSSAGSYLGFLADAATDLLMGKQDTSDGQWRDCPWPERRKIGFVE